MFNFLFPCKYKNTLQNRVFFVKIFVKFFSIIFIKALTIDLIFYIINSYCTKCCFVYTWRKPKEVAKKYFIGGNKCLQLIN